MQYDLALRCLFYPPAVPMVQVWMPGLKVKDKRDTRRRGIPMPLFTSATNMKPMHRLTPNFWLVIPVPFLSYSLSFLVLLPSRVSAPFHAFRISWKVTRATIATCLKWESPSIFLPRLPFSFIREKRLCINAPKFMAEKRRLASDFLLVPMKVSAIQQFSFEKRSLFRPHSLQSDN